MTLHLVDTSAFAQTRHSEVAEEIITSLASDHQVAVCEVTALELLYSTRGSDDYEQRWAGLQSLVWLAVTEEATARALAIQRELARTGHHRRPLPDLLIAATALVHRAMILHYDRDFDLIAEVTRQPTRWIIPRGSGHDGD